MIFNNLSTTQKAVCALIIANIIWGAAPPIFKWVLTEIGPFTLAFFRFSIASLIILPFAYKKLRVAKKDIVRIILLGLTGITANISFFFLGLQHAPSINASIIGSAGPIFILLTSIFFLKENPKKKLIYGALIGLIGVLLIILKPLLQQGPSASVLGNLLLFFGMLSATAQVLIGRKILPFYPTATIVFYAFFIGAVTFLPLFYLETESDLIIKSFNAQVIIGITFGAILASSLAYFLYYTGIKKLSASESGLFLYIDPVITVLIAAPLLQEYPDIIFLAGTVFVFGGIFIAEGRINYHPFHKLKNR